MSMSAGPQPGISSEITINGVPLNVIPGQWDVSEAVPFGPKISTGALTYQDLNPYLATHAVTTLHGGFGQGRFSDSDNPSDSQVLTRYAAARDVDCRFFPITLGGYGGPDVVLAGSAVGDQTVWIGEWTPSAGAVGLAPNSYMVAVCGNHVYYQAGGGWVNTGYVLAAAATCVAVSGGTLIIGYGAAATAQTITTLDASVAPGNVTDTAPTNLYVYAITTDHAAIYIAGGTAASKVNHVNSATTPTTFALPAAAGDLTCTYTDNPITALAPGGGLALVYVGRQKELGQIALNGTYQTLVPFDSNLTTNCKGMRWWLSAGGDAQRGPVILIFPRDHALWTYAPSSQDAGTAQNIEPWVISGKSVPYVYDTLAVGPTAIGNGLPTAIQGTAGWLYYATQKSTSPGATEHNNCWLCAVDAGTGETHVLTNFTQGLGAVKIVSAMAVGHLNPADPKLYLFAAGTYANGVTQPAICHITLPADGDTPVTDPNYNFISIGSLWLPGIDFGLPGEQKIVYSVDVVADDLTATETITVNYALESGTIAPIALGVATTSPETTLPLSPALSGKTVYFRLDFARGASQQVTPKLRAFVIRASINAKVQRIWTFKATSAAGAVFTGGFEDTSNPQTTIASFWAMRGAGTPVPFVDRWQDSYSVRILQFGEHEVARGQEGTPETELTFQLLELN